MSISPIQGLRPWVIAHRGNPGNPLNSKCVENTVSSIDSAWSSGADGVEFDVILSKDGVLVVHHDDNFGRVFKSPDGDNDRLVSSYTWGEIKNAKFNPSCLKGILSRKAHEPDSIKIPRLEDLPLQGKGKIFLELKFKKDLEPQSPEEEDYLENIVKAVVDFLQDKNLLDDAYVLSFVPSALDRVKELDPNIGTAYNICQHEGERRDIEKLLKVLKGEYGFDIINPPVEQTTERFIEACHNLGLRTYPWVWKQDASKEIREFKRLLGLGVDGIITNQPEEAVKLVH